MPPNRLEVILSGNVKPLADSFLEAAARADDLGDSLKATFGDAADAVAAFSQEMGNAGGPFSAEEFGGAAQRMQTFGAFTEEALKRAADAAAYTKQPLEGIAEAMGKFDKFQDAKSTLALQKAIGAAGEDLAKYGAKLDDNNKLLLDNERQVEDARKAIEAFMDANFAGAMERMADPAAKLAGQTNLLKQELGQASFELRDSFAPSMLSAVEAMRGLPEPLKGAVGLTIDFAANAGPAAAQALMMAAHIKTLGFSITAMSGALVATVAVFASAAIGLALYTAEVQKANKAAEDLLSIEEKRAKALRENSALIGAGAEEWKKAGKTAKDVAETITALHDQAEQARARGDSAAEGRINQQIASLQAIKGKFAEVETAKRDETKRTQDAQKAAFDAADKAAAAYKANVSAGTYASTAEQLAALDKVLGALNKQDKLYQELAASRVKIARKAADEEVKADEEARKKKLALAEAAASKAGVNDKGAEVAALKVILAEYQLTAEERIKIETKVATEEKSIRDKAAADHKKRQEDARKQAEETAKLQQQTLAAEEKSQQATVAGLEAKLAKGEDVLAQLEAERKKLLELEEAQIRARAKSEGSGKTGSQRAEIEKAADAEVAAARKTHELDVEKTRDQVADKQRANQLAELELNEKIAKAKEDQAKRDMDAGKNTGSVWIEQMKQRLALHEQELKLKAEDAQATATPEESLRIQKQLELDLAEARRQGKEELKGANEELNKAHEATEKLKGGMDGAVMSLDDFVKSMNEGWDSKASFTSDDSAGTPDLTIPDAGPQQDTKNLSGGKSDKPRQNPGGGGGGTKTEELLIAMHDTLKNILVAAQAPVTVDLKGGGTAGHDHNAQPNRARGM